MNRFIDREGANLNRKSLKVTKLEYDESDTLILTVEESRDDMEDLETEGTPLNASTLNNIFNEMETNLNTLVLKVKKLETESTNLNERIIQEKANILDTVDEVLLGKENFMYTLINMIDQIHALTDEEKVLLAKDNLSFESEVTSNFTLPITGLYNTNITWSVADGTAITIDGSEAVVTRKYKNQTAILEARIVKNEAVILEYYEFVVPAKVVTQLELLNDRQYIDDMLPSNVTDNFELPYDLPSKAEISWESSDITKLSINNGVATVSRSQYNSYITLTASIDYGTYIETKNYSVTIVGYPTYAITNEFLEITRNENNLQQAKTIIYLEPEGPLTVEIARPFSYFDCSIANNGTTSVITVSETEEVSNLNITNYLDDTMEISMYYGEEHIYVGTHTITVLYYV